MIDITHKKSSHRRATATGRVVCSAETLRRIAENTLPKGDLFHTAKAAGLLAAKQTPHLIPHCHPVAIESLEITFQLIETGIEITVSGESIGKTGIEMEVLTGCTITALTLYDLLKPVDRTLEIASIRLVEKRGGKSDRENENGGAPLACAVLICSDSAAKGERNDATGPAIRKKLEGFGLSVAAFRIVPDEPEQIETQLREWIASDLPFLFTSGGTGFGPRDRTVEVVRRLIEKEAPGIAEAMRRYGADRTGRALLSRSVAGSVGRTLIVTLPGSPRGATESLDAILPDVLHIRAMLEGGGH